MNGIDLINFRNFIVATRDSGYRSTAFALSELIDNSIEAKARSIKIKFDYLEETGYQVTVADDGKGMTVEDLELALQFGGSSRFNSRSDFGRYGMGLPNSSLSQCKEVKVYSWQKNQDIFFAYLDVDEIVEKGRRKLIKPKRISGSHFPVTSKSGTVVIWNKCDRLSFKYLNSFKKSLAFELGKVFRYALWDGVRIIIDDTVVIPFDPPLLKRRLKSMW